MVWVVRLTAAVCLAASLGGCANALTPPPQVGLSAEEREQARAQWNDDWWESTGLDDELRPDETPVQVASSVEWSAAFAGCMNDKGFDQYTVQSGGLEVQGNLPATPEFELANYTCSVRLEHPGRFEGLLGPVEAGFRYEYFQDSLVPCLAMRGIELFDVPTRKEFFETYGSWNPYWSVEEDDAQVAYTVETAAACSPVPPGVPDPGYFSFG